ncbi:GIY-YIG nuclease family protein [Bacillus canaveralius]|uniref:GIY-YIG nuclease family protein n=1 Tax=Bacillus canaveralius TaxID=1403243 RepID=UPI000F78CC1E|nr:GIY-YIG nuclease family protein [Bacillus canaveralius]RSK53269.1 GIY-YIG nuclease family protein [Bacillus canaveralius]
MDRKKELKLRYKEMPIEAGVYQIKNNINKKILIGSTKNLKILNGVKLTLETGVSTNRELQEEWIKYGQNAFTIEVIEILEKKADPYFNEKEALLMLEGKWLEQLQPYEDRGYNRKKVR